jgi:hypothetical protein
MTNAEETKLDSGADVKAKDNDGKAKSSLNTDDLAPSHITLHAPSCSCSTKMSPT